MQDVVRLLDLTCGRDAPGTTISRKKLGALR
jgi:hypothetical protein